MSYLPANDVARVAAVFSSAVFRELGGKSLGPRAQSGLDLLRPLVINNPAATTADAFDHVHAWMQRDYRNEYVFKNGLISKLVFGKHSPRTASALLETPMGRSCADVVILNGTSTTYEIKTDLDQLNRLSTQLESYASRTEHVCLVTSERRAAVAERNLPSRVGIVAVRANGALRTVRPSTGGLDRVDTDHLFQLLRTEEAARILRRVSGYELDVKPGFAWPRMREIFAELSVPDAHREVLGELKLRARRAVHLAIDPAFPPSLRALAYATNLSGAANERLLRRLSQHPESVT